MRFRITKMQTGHKTYVQSDVHLLDILFAKQVNLNVLTLFWAGESGPRKLHFTIGMHISL